MRHMFAQNGTNQFAHDITIHAGWQEPNNCKDLAPLYITVDKQRKALQLNNGIMAMKPTPN
ncbi:uncharacterized protein ACA1_231400 [Acanthamoeba castellanii str. Neff]|uniref:Uncharacterized protein n=1 Tax=Acanthamoeba castellanii (strain ATCC 30010 / Neff) TaxID=1257118 RepID=L8HAE8_ACACF|nr:uncharacterized protein ACA1_231400 [Acanthamoeba castellanii str. Neff]ELR21683.1 hypothetical protein ACA1_231400 [Acanthamoeba castellanii str. Neff]